MSRPSHEPQGYLCPRCNEFYYAADQYPHPPCPECERAFALLAHGNDKDRAFVEAWLDRCVTRAVRTALRRASEGAYT
jgi:hypothetical protein